MKLTVPFPVSDRTVEEKGILPWINGETQKLLKQLRAALNYRGSERATAATAGAGAYVTVWTSDALPTDACWSIVAHVVAVSVSGAAQRAGYVLSGTFESTAGVVAQVGTDTVISTHESAAAINARFGVDATARTIYVEARDDATSPMNVTVVVHVNEALP